MGLKSYQRTGVLTKSDLKARGLIPLIERLQSGPVAIVECIENIPCNPCVEACPRHAIMIKGNLTETPQVEFSQCNGCGTCISQCPGLAIFVVNYGYSSKEATVSLPYELLPRPVPGERVVGLDRSGKRVCEGRIVKVLEKEFQNHCAVVTVAVPKKLWNDVRGIRLKKR